MTALVKFEAALDAAKATLLEAFKDSHSEMCGDMWLDFGEQLSGEKLLTDVERYCAEQNAQALREYWLLRLQSAAADLRSRVSP